MPSQNTQIQLAYQVCPIILTGGSVAQVPGAMVPMLSLFSPGGTSLNLPFDINDLDDAFGAFNIVAGGQLVLQTIAKYPFANQSVGANAVIKEPLTLSVIMDSPMRGPNAWAVKRTVFSALKGALDSHNNVGGTYTIATPAYMYDNMVMTALTDNSRGNSALPQNAWRFDFERPLVALQDLQDAQNAQMSKLTIGLQTLGGISGTQIPSHTAQPGQMRTFITAGALSGGGPSLVITRSSDNTNYLPLPNPAGVAYNGVS